MKPKWVDPDDAPPLTGEEIHRPDARWRVGGKSVPAEEGKAAFRAAFRIGKTRVNIHLDNDVIAHFKAKAGERGYQTLINAALRQDLEGKQPDQGGGSLLAAISGCVNQAIRKALSEVAGHSASPRLVVMQFPPQPGQTEPPPGALQGTQSNNDLRKLNS